MARILDRQEILQLLRRGIRANLAPGIVLQIFALTLVGAYYTSAEVANWLNRVGS